MASTLKDEPEFVIDKPVPGNDSLHFVRRVIDAERYLANEYDSQEFPELSTLRETKPDDEIVAFEAAARLLNHENLISVVKPMATTPRTGRETRMGSDFSLVYEYCADGDLKQLLDKPPMEATDQGFLPEGLVWHVALSMLRALTFLHEGRRERVIMSKDDGRLFREWYRPDDDWMPVLHRSIRPENIHFQAARGMETYGLCKLGDFGRCVLAGTARLETEHDHVEVVATLENSAGRILSQQEVLRAWKLAHEKREHGSPDRTRARRFGRIYTIGSELADLGAILCRMMTGERVEVDLCSCGCFHIDPEPPGCQCSCSIKDVQLDKVLSESSKYSVGLAEVVISLMRLNRGNSARAHSCFESAWLAYRRWRLTTNGKAHFDHYDDLLARKRAERSRRLEERTRELGDVAIAEWEQDVKKKDENLIMWN